MAMSAVLVLVVWSLGIVDVDTLALDRIVLLEARCCEGFGPIGGMPLASAVQTVVLLEKAH